MKSMNSIVRDALALHLDRDVTTIHAWQELDRDLDLTPLELVLVALEVEDVHGVEVPVEEIVIARTVGDLVSLFVLNVTRGRRRRVVHGTA